MAKLCINQQTHYLEQSGSGLALVFLHGAFADARLWEPQWRHFAAQYHLVRYDLRGHGHTGASDLTRYSMATFADDLLGLLDALQIETAVLCGLSWGGSIAQAFATQHPERLKGLVLAGSMVSIRLTLLDKLLCDLLFPRWAMLATIRLMRVEKFVRFSLWLGRLTQGRNFLSRNEAAQAYLKECMLSMQSREYLKIWEAMYAFNCFPLEKISCPTLVLNGEYESHNIYRHTAEVLRRVPGAKANVIPGAAHGMNMDNPQAFNRLVDDFCANLS